MRRIARHLYWGTMDPFNVSHNIEYLTEIVKNKLYFGVTFSDRTEPIRNTPDIFYFTIDDELLYMNYYMDFGPLNISCLYKYCMKLNAYMQCGHIRRIVHYCSSNQNKRVNAAYLLGSYSIIYLNMDPKCAYRKLLDAGGPYRQFVDASQGVSRYTLKLIECLLGIHKAWLLNFFNFNDFNVAEYDLYDKIQNGDFNWLVPRKFLALIGPVDRESSVSGHPPSFYIKYFLKNDVRTVIRLNNKMYNPHSFIEAGIDHYDLFFPDGTTPPKHILLRFLQIAEKSPGAIAVHCKAGLGRTGSLIGAYIMKHYQFTAKEAIAWMRICRPGSVIGQQQGWLEKIETWLWKQGTLYRLEHFGEGDRLPHHKYGIYSKTWLVERKKMLLLANKRAQLEQPYLYDYDACKMKPPDALKSTREVRENKPYFRSFDRVRSELGSTLKRFRPNEKTQGDHLNEIKMQKYVGNVMTPNNNAACYFTYDDRNRFKGPYDLAHRSDTLAEKFSRIKNGECSPTGSYRVNYNRNRGRSMH